jgi:fluoride exporter
MVKVLLIGLGGCVGSILRYAASGLAQSIFRTVTFPLGTMVVNLTGCFLIGALFQLAETRGAFSDTWRAFIFIGVLGGYTTFSAFGNETISLMRVGETFLASVNVVAQVAGGLFCVWLGRTLAYLMWR